MWLNIILSIMPINSFFEDTSMVNDLNIKVGTHYSQLDESFIEILNTSESWEVDNRVYRSNISAPNTDNCIVFSAKCQLDFVHFVYKIPNQIYKGHYYLITFSYNYRVISVQDSYRKTAG